MSSPSNHANRKTVPLHTEESPPAGKHKAVAAATYQDSQHHLSKAYSDVDGLNEQSIARGSNVWARFKFEWKRENLWFSGDYPSTYGKLHWARAFGNSGAGCWCCSRARGDERNAEFRPMTPWLWIAWRTLVAAYLLAIFVYSVANFWEDGQWFYYLTNWQTTIFMLYGFLSLFSAVYIQRNYKESLEGDLNASAKLIGADPRSHHPAYRMPALVKATWVLQGLAMSLGIWVTLVFWLNVAIFGYGDPDRLPFQLIDHGSTMLLVLIDFALASFPWLLFQFVWSAFVAVAYIVWSVIHYELNLSNKFDGGRYLYHGLDWSTPAITFFVLLFLIALGIPLVSVTVWILSSEAMGKCAPRRLVPWIDQDGSGGHRLKSLKKSTKPKSKTEETTAATTAVVAVDHVDDV